MQAWCTLPPPPPAHWQGCPLIFHLVIMVGASMKRSLKNTPRLLMAIPVKCNPWLFVPDMYIPCYSCDFYIPEHNIPNCHVPSWMIDCCCGLYACKCIKAFCVYYADMHVCWGGGALKVLCHPMDWASVIPAFFYIRNVFCPTPSFAILIPAFVYSIQ